MGQALGNRKIAAFNFRQRFLLINSESSNMIALITGGIRSGKSRHALELAQQCKSLGRKCFLATAEPLDDEMKVRIAKHQEERADDFLTVEEPLYLSRAIEKAQNDHSLVLVDCLTVWIGNLLFRFADTPNQIRNEIESLLHVISLKKTDMFFVTNEVGLGLIPDNPLGRRYIDELGNLNQRIARLSDEVVFMVSGIPALMRGGVDARMGH